MWDKVCIMTGKCTPILTVIWIDFRYGKNFACLNQFICSILIPNTTTLSVHQTETAIPLAQWDSNQVNVSKRVGSHFQSTYAVALL